MTSTAQNLLSILLALGVPGLIGLLVPKRWRLATLILWMLGPALVFLVLGGIEAARDPVPIDWGKLLHGVALILSVLALPWLLACLAGFALGSALRRKRVASALPAAMVPARPAGQGGDASAYQPAQGWQVAHIGTGNDGFVLDGLSVWTMPWQPETTARVMLPHPAHPRQMHDFAVYTINNGKDATRFAAAELSNGVWGFYRWAAPANPYIRQYMAPDGSLMVELEALEWTNGHWVHPPRVTELATGRRLLDLWGRDWDASAEFPRGRMVRLSMYSHRRDTMLAVEIDLATGHYAVEGSAETGAVAALQAYFDGAPIEAPFSSSLFLPPARPRATRRSLGIALLILLGALLAIGAATYVTMRLAPDHRPQKLDRVPAVPRL